MRAIVVLLLLLTAMPVEAQDVFVGLRAHDIENRFGMGSFEDGAEIELGLRGGRLRALRFLGAPSPYLFGAVATNGATSVAAAGLSWRLSHGRLFVRPGVGLAVHTGPGFRVSDQGVRTDLGSRILFEPELGIGVQVSDRVAIEATWVHISHAQLFSPQNPGMDSVGIRMSFRLH